MYGILCENNGIPMKECDIFKVLMVYHSMLINALPESTVTLSETVLATFICRFSCTF